ncbi:MAG: hypothetical protein EOO39_37085 [Cytophagaceae bacterium]|nr:MAG: hypothetical protein EOO39_37085 [Cytophagaceae bacterium]
MQKHFLIALSAMSIAYNPLAVFEASSAGKPDLLRVGIDWNGRVDYSINPFVLKDQNSLTIASGWDYRKLHGIKVPLSGGSGCRSYADSKSKTDKYTLCIAVTPKGNNTFNVEYDEKRYDSNPGATGDTMFNITVNFDIYINGSSCSISPISASTLSHKGSGKIIPSPATRFTNVNCRVNA